MRMLETPTASTHRRTIIGHVVVYLLHICCYSTLLGTARSQCETLRRRRPWRDLSCSEQSQFQIALQQLKDSGIYDELVLVHWNSGDDSHNVPEFLPWHRWFLYQMETALQDAVNDPCLTIPFWDWGTGDSLPTVLKEWTFGSRNGGGCVEDGVAVDWDVAQRDRRCLRREFDDDWHISRDSEVLSRITNFDTYSEFAEALEGAPHAGPHEYIGGAMAVNWSPDDPLFWLHHSQVDRIWALWQDYRGHDEVAPADYQRRHYSRDLDRSLRYRTRSDAIISFWYPGRDRPPTPREVLSNQGPVIRVRYERDELASRLLETSERYRNGGYNTDWFRASNGPVQEQCRTGQENSVDWTTTDTPTPAPTTLPPTSAPTDVATCLDEFFECNDDTAGDCCGTLRCSSRTNTCVNFCYGRYSRCQRDADCCSDYCRTETGRCDQRPAVQERLQPMCLIHDERCRRSSECCSDFCSSRTFTCANMCLGRGQDCASHGDCCSGFCNNNGHCDVPRHWKRRTLLRQLTADDTPSDEEYDDIMIQQQWQQVGNETTTAQFWADLAQQECEGQGSSASE